MTKPRTWTLRLAYDVLPLSLNQRGAWQKQWRASRVLRDRVRLLARHHRIPRLHAIDVELHWTPRTRRTRDRDNAVATLKPIVDGLRDYPARYKRDKATGARLLAQPAWRGVVVDDDPAHVGYGMPILHTPNPDPLLTERLVVVITERKET